MTVSAVLPDKGIAIGKSVSRHLHMRTQKFPFKLGDGNGLSWSQAITSSCMEGVHVDVAVNII